MATTFSSSIRRALWMALSTSLALFLPPATQAQGSPEIDGPTLVLRDGSLVFQFRAAQASASDFQVVRTESLRPPIAWRTAENAIVTAVADDLYQVSLPTGDSAGSFLRLLRSGPPPPGLAPRLNEVMSENLGAHAGPTGEFWDWIELFNPHDEALELTGFSLSDDPATPGLWRFPAITLQPGAYLVVYASDLNRTVPGEPLHTNFKLSASGDTLVLSDRFDREVDRLTLPPLAADQSLGRSVAAPDTWRYFAKSEVTPGRENSASSTAPLVEAPEITPVGGFYPGPVEVTIRAARVDQIVRYTTNGIPPSPDSPVFGASRKFERTTVVRAAAFDGAGNRGEEIGHTFLIGTGHRLPVVSLATDPANLSFRDGYLTGMGSQVLNAKGEVLQTYPYSGSNAWKDREIEVHLELFEPDGSTGLRQRAGVKVFGGWGSRGYPQKSLALFARRQYGAARFPHRVFPDLPIEDFEGLVLRNSGNDNQSTHQTPPRNPITAFGPTKSYGSYFVNSTFTLMRDAMMQRLLVGETDLDTQGYRPAVLYVNGEYWGIQNLREKMNEAYVDSHHDLPAGRVDLIEGYGDVRAGDGVAYRALRDFINTRSPAVETNYQFVADHYLEIDNFIDYNLAVIYFQNFDIGNIKCWRPRVEGGRFRWLVFDQDYGFDLWPHDVYVPAMARDYADYANMFRFATAGTGTSTGWPNAGGRTLLLRRMLLNPGFRDRFITRCADLLNGAFREERVVNVITEMAAVIRPEIPDHLERWSWPELQKLGYSAPYKPENQPLTAALWETHLQTLVAFARQRPTALRADCQQHFRLNGGLGTVALEVTPAGAGSIQLNTLRVATFPWSGTYFADLPVRLLPVARPGFRFVGWTTSRAESTEPSLEESVVRGATNAIVARFEPGAATAVPTARLWITEINYHSPNDLDADDWVEIHNPGDQAVDLEGWTLRDRNDDPAFLLPRTSLPAQGYGVICRNLAKFKLAHPTAPEPLGEAPLRFANEGDRVRLQDPRGVVVEDVTYDDRAPWPAAADGGGGTLQLTKPELDHATPAAWSVSTVRGGTPGRASL